MADQTCACVSIGTHQQHDPSGAARSRNQQQRTKNRSRDDRNYCLNAQGPIGSTHPEHDPKKACPGPDPGIMLKRQAKANADSI
jgi:hypothetical protein